MTLLRAVLWVFTGALADLSDTVLVWARIKYRPATGPARWQSDRPKPDPRASAWQYTGKEIDMTKHPKRVPAQDAQRHPAQRSAVANVSTHTPGQSMTCDRPCMTERGLLIHTGTVVTYLERVALRQARVRMEDGSEEIVNPDCFPEMR